MAPEVVQTMNLFDKRFVVNTGKGGVGKSTISAAMALAAAKRGKRVLVCELNTKERISRLFGRPEVGHEITKIHENLWAINITPATAMKEYVLMKLRFELVYKAVFENRLVKAFLGIMPGLSELVMIGKVWFHEQQVDKQGDPVFDIIVVDAPATGHGLFLLRLPQIIVEVVRTGPMHRECRAILDLLQDPERTALNLITLTEEMPVNETIELKAAVDSELDMPPGYLIANGIYPRLFSGHKAEHISTLMRGHHLRDDLMGQLLAAGMFRHERCRLQTSYLRLLDRKLNMPMIEVPYFFEPQLSFETINRIAEHIEACVERRVGKK